MSEFIQQQIDSIQQQVQLAEAGYEAFRRMYARTNPPPPTKPYKSRSGWARAAIGGVMAASSIVSASHTIPVFAGTMGDNPIANLIHLAVGIAAFIMGEMALATYAYTGVMRHFRDTGAEPASLKRLLRWGVGVPVVIMVAANISHQFETSGEYIDPRIMSGIRLAIALAAPLMAYISGEVFATFEVGDRIDEAAHEADQLAKRQQYEERCRTAWGREKGNYAGRVRVDPVPVQALSNGSNGQSNGYSVGNQPQNVQVIPSKSSIGHTKKPQASKDARDYFEAHPDELIDNNPNNAIAAGVAGRSTVYKVLADMRAERGL